MANITFTIEVSLDKTQGKFVSKDDLAEEIRTELEANDPGTVQVDESEYEVTNWDVSFT
jgi:hypothetical protein